MSVAFATDQRKVADCPRSMVAGSAVKVSIRAACGLGGGGGGGGAGAAAGGGAGGGGGAGVFFLQPAAATNNTAPNTAALSVLLSNRIPSFPPTALLSGFVLVY